MLLRFVILLVLCTLAGCVASEEKPAGPVTIVFRHGKIEGDPRLFRAILDDFERRNPGIRVVEEILPSSTDEQHQSYIINLESDSASFDVLALDVIWMAEFVRAGWLRDLSGQLPPPERSAFFPGAMEAVTVQGRVYAIPWYLDAGVLYYRTDLLRRRGLRPPRTWYELVRQAQALTRDDPTLYGFIWQGRQDESLVCNALEYMWGMGGDILAGGAPVLESAENREALRFMHDLIVTYRVTPPLVTTAAEEETRQLFANGRAVFMRNWPYALRTLRRPGEPLRDRVALAQLPSFPGGASVSALGGWQLGVNRRAPHPAEAEKLVAYLTSAAAQKRLAVGIGYLPSRMALYDDPGLRRVQPDIDVLRQALLAARPRPISPYYMMITQVLQPELSAAISGIRTPEKALASAQRQVLGILGVGK